MRNEALSRLSGLIGVWDVTMSNAFFLDSLDQRVKGRATFEWLDDALVVFRWQMHDVPGPVVSVIGHSDPQERYEMLYHDDRGVARIFDMEFGGDRWTLMRRDRDFHQRFTAEVSGGSIAGSWEASEDEGRTWRKDFDLLFEKTSGQSPQ